MDLLIIFAAFCLSLSFMLAPCASDQHHLEKCRPRDNLAQFSIPSLPRKFKLEEEANVKIAASKAFTLRAKPMEASSVPGKVYHKEENLAHAAKGTWREWVEGAPEKAEYFTMDYGRVRRRRPIHNKRVPITP